MLELSSAAVGAKDSAGTYEGEDTPDTSYESSTKEEELIEDKTEPAAREEPGHDAQETELPKHKADGDINAQQLHEKLPLLPTVSSLIPIPSIH